MATMVTDEKHAKPESTDEVSVEGVGITGLDESNVIFFLLQQTDNGKKLICAASCQNTMTRRPSVFFAKSIIGCCLY